MATSQNNVKKHVSIKGEEAPLSKVFSKEFLFEIPSFQRPYSWTEEEAGILFDDLYDFYKDDSLKEENYFLGSIVLIKEEEKPLSLVIDGQQRLTTLTVLFSAIAYLIDNQKYKDNCIRYIVESGNLAEDIPPQYRLSLREKDATFFQENVQDLKFEKMRNINTLGVSEPQRHLVLNSLLFIEKLKVFDNDEELFDFFKFLINRCYIVVVSTHSKESAFRVFSVMNNRGLDLLAIDILKADIIGQIDSEEIQQIYTEKWESIEQSLGRDRFNDLVSHIRTIATKSKAKKSILEEFSEFVLKQYKGENGSINLIDEVFEPYSDAFAVIVGSSYKLSENPEVINGTLKWLNRLDNSDWIPPAMIFYKKYKDRPEYLEPFLIKLERLAAYLRVESIDVTHRIERYALVSNDIEKGENGYFGTNIELTEDEKSEFISKLGTDIYLMTSNKAFYILFRLDSFMSTGDAIYDLSTKSIEHVLPQTPDPESQWCKNWTDEEREKWTNKIANLVLLNRRKNSSAGNKEFEEKKETYFKVGGTTPFALTASVLNEPNWTPTVVEERQKEIINLFKQKWDL